MEMSVSADPAYRGPLRMGTLILRLRKDARFSNALEKKLFSYRLD